MNTTLHLSNDEIIAQFMGYIRLKSELGNTWHHPDLMGVYGGSGMKFLYSKSWDKLIPVLERIENLGFSTTIKYDGISTTVTIGPNIVIFENPSTKIEKVYRAVLLFIKWHNENVK